MKFYGYNEEQFAPENLKDSLQPSPKIDDNAIDLTTFILMVYAGLFIFTVMTGNKTISIFFIILTIILLLIFISKRFFAFLVKRHNR